MSDGSDLSRLNEKLDTLIGLIERAVPAQPCPADFDAAEAFVWSPHPGELVPVAKVNRVDITLLCAVSRLRDLASRLFTASPPTVSAIGPVDRLMDIDSIRSKLTSGAGSGDYHAARAGMRLAVG